MRTDMPQTIFLNDYTPYPYAIPNVHLTFDLSPERTRVTTRMDVICSGDIGAPMELNGEAFEDIASISVNGDVVPSSEYQYENGILTLVNLPERFTLETEVYISPEKNTELSGLYMSGGRFCTQCEAEGFRRITFWPDRPDVMSVFSVRLEADKAFAPILLSNGNPGATGDLSETRHFAEWSDPHPKPSYLFALCGGDYDVLEDQFMTKSGNNVDLKIFVDKGSSPRAAYAMDSLKRSMKWDEDTFGREYDLNVFNIVAVRDFNFGAMENKGLNIFNSAYVLADADTATDRDFEAIESIVAHEYFHNWTGNRITCRDWFQLCLKEGLTVYRDQEFSADMRSRPVQRIKDVIALRGRQFSEDAGPLAHPVRPDRYARIDNLYTATVYEKGAELIRALKTYLGEDVFAKGIDLYFKNYDGQATTIEAFYEGFEEAAGFDLARFRQWYAQAGTPLVKLEIIDRDNGKGRLRITQTTPPTPGQDDKKPVPIPLRVAAFTETGEQLNLQTGKPFAPSETDVLAITDTVTEIDLATETRSSLLSANRGFSAPVKIEQDMSDEDVLKLADLETDPFAKWEAIQSVSRKTLLAMANAQSKAESLSTPTRLVDAIARNTRLYAKTDPAFAAQLLTLPGVGELFMEMSPADPVAIFEAKRVVRSELAAILKSEIDEMLSEAEKPFTPDAKSAGQRALKGAYIDLLAADGTMHEAQIYMAFETATNMTDRMAAFRALSYTGGKKYDDAIASFEADWKDMPLVMDKWFSIQASQPSSQAIRRVSELIKHPDFDWKNPNRVRSVAAAFAMGNHVAFHDPSGDGYALIGDIIKTVDPLNGALSARLLTSFEQWGRVSEDLQSKAQHILKELQSASLSKNAMDIVNRSVAS